MDNKVKVSFKDRLKKAWIKSRGVFFAISVVFNLLFLCFFLFGIFASGASGASATDDTSLIIGNTLGLDDSTPSYVIATSTGYERVPATISETGSYGSSYFPDSSSWSYSYFPFKTGRYDSSLGFESRQVFSQSPFVMPDLSMPGLPSELDSSSPCTFTFYYNFTSDGFEVSDTRTSFTFAAVNFHLRVESMPGFYFGSSSSSFYRSFVLDYSVTNYNLSFLNFDHSIVTCPYDFDFDSLCGLLVTASGADSGYSGSFYLTFAPNGGSSYFAGFCSASTSSTIPFDDVYSYLPTSSSSAGSLEISFYLGLSNSLIAPTLDGLTPYEYFAVYESGLKGSYDDGYDAGYNVGFSDGYDKGYDLGNQVGVDEGVASSSPLTSFAQVLTAGINSISSILNLDLFGLSLGTWMFIPMAISLIWFLVQFFNRGS